MIERPDPRPPTSRSGGPLDRRNLLRGSGLTALALGGGGVLVACAGPGEPDPATTGGSGGSPVPSGSPSADGDTPSPSGSPGGAAPDGVEVDPASVPVGGGVVLPDADFVVTQPEQGTFRAFSKICTHQGCPVSEVADSEIVCFCHGSAFSVGDGSVLQGPADQPLGEATVTDQDGRLYIS